MGSERRLGHRNRCAPPSSSFPPGQARQEVLENTATGQARQEVLENTATGQARQEVLENTATGQARQEVLENTATGRLQASGLTAPPNNATHSTMRSKLGLRLFLTEVQLMYNII